MADTAGLHAEAWKRLFDEAVVDPRTHARPSTRQFDPVEDYRRGPS